MSRLSLTMAALGVLALAGCSLWESTVGSKDEEAKAEAQPPADAAVSAIEQSGDAAIAPAAGGAEPRLGIGDVVLGMPEDRLLAVREVTKGEGGGPLIYDDAARQMVNGLPYIVHYGIDDGRVSWISLANDRQASREDCVAQFDDAVSSLASRYGAFDAAPERSLDGARLMLHTDRTYIDRWVTVETTHHDDGGDCNTTIVYSFDLLRA